MSTDERPASTKEVWTSPERTKSLRATAERWTAATRQSTTALLGALELEPGHRVLDIACGSGDPTLAVAHQVGPRGVVEGIDISEGALEVARELAKKAGYSNVSFRAANAESLPFPDAGFDRVVSRFGFMFIEDLPRALREVRRVLRPSGRLALMVWGPFDQPYWRATAGVVLERLGLKELPPAQRVPFRFAVANGLEATLREAEFVGIREASRVVPWELPDSAKGYVDEWWSTAIFFRPLLDRLPAAAADATRAEIVQRMAAFEHDGMLRVPTSVRIVTASQAG